MQQSSEALARALARREPGTPAARLLRGALELVELAQRLEAGYVAGSGAVSTR